MSAPALERTSTFNNSKQRSGEAAVDRQFYLCTLPLSSIMLPTPFVLQTSFEIPLLGLFGTVIFSLKYTCDVHVNEKKKRCKFQIGNVRVCP